MNTGDTLRRVPGSIRYASLSLSPTALLPFGIW